MPPTPSIDAATAERRATNAPEDLSPPVAVPLPAGVDPTVGFLVQHLSTQATEASRERAHQTQQFTGALDKLGGRFEAKMDAQTNVMVKAATVAAGVVVLALLILGSIAGAVTYFKGGGVEAGSQPAGHVGPPPIPSGSGATVPPTPDHDGASDGARAPQP